MVKGIDTLSGHSHSLRGKAIHLNRSDAGSTPVESANV